MAGIVGVALRGFGKALKNLSKNKKLKDKVGLFSTGAATGIVVNEASKPKKKKSKAPMFRNKKEFEAKKKSK